jgi:large conductance mechanosensitive channel
VLTAAVVYLLIVVPMNTMVERRRHGSEPEPEEVSEDVMVLREIRDLLASRQS